MSLAGVLVDNCYFFNERYTCSNSLFLQVYLSQLIDVLCLELTNSIEEQFESLPIMKLVGVLVTIIGLH